MSGDYGYINARIRAMKSFLLKEEDYINAMRQRTRDEYISFLSSLPGYANDGGDLKLNMCRIFKKIADFCEGSPKGLIQILLAPLDETSFKAAQESLSDVDYNSRVVLDYLSIQIDFIKIRLAISGSRPEDILQKFNSSPYPWLAHEGLDLYNRTKRLSSIERLLRNRLFSHCLSLYTNSDPLSIAIPLAYINFKENEISNLRLISEAIHFGMPMELVKEELIYAR